MSSLVALTNAVKCSAQTGSMTTNATREMIEACASHLLREIQLLVPDLIVTQGDHPTTTVTRLTHGLRPVSQYVGTSRGRASVTENDNLVILATPHPARLPGLKWTRDVLPDFLEEATASARSRLSALLARKTRIANSKKQGS
jgi:uracil-DNA glycosylase family 4